MNRELLLNSSLAVPRMRGYRTAMSGGLLSISSSVFCTEKYRGGVRKDGGVNKNGGASWFVFLAAKKNEQIKRINVTRTFFGRERKSFVSQSSLAVPRSIAVCGAKKYRGELRSVATRRGIKKTSNGSNRVNPPLPLCFRKGI